MALDLDREEDFLQMMAKGRSGPGVPSLTRPAALASSSEC